MSNFLLIEKEVYEAVLRNSLKVNALEKENAKLKEDCKDFEMIRREARAEVKRLKEQLEVATKAIKSIQNEDIDGGLSMFCQNIVDQIKQIGEK